MAVACARRAQDGASTGPGGGEGRGEALSSPVPFMKWTRHLEASCDELGIYPANPKTTTKATQIRVLANKPKREIKRNHKKTFN